MPGNTGHSEYTKGMAALITSMVMWGVLPVYWKSLIPIDSWVIILYRILLVKSLPVLKLLGMFCWLVMELDFIILNLNYVGLIFLLDIILIVRQKK